LLQFLLKKTRHDTGPGLSKKFFFKQNKNCAWIQLSKKIFFQQQQKNPHPAQRHDSNSAFRWLIAAYFFKKKKDQ